MSTIDPRVGAARICAELIKAQVPKLEPGQLAELAGGAVDEAAVREALSDLVAELLSREAMPSSGDAIAELARRQQKKAAADKPDKESSINVTQLLTSEVLLGATATMLAEAHVRDAWPKVSMADAKITQTRQQVVAKLVFFYLCGKAGLGS